MARTLDQILANEKPEVVANAQAAATEMLLNIHLAELRERVQKTQGEIALALGIKQPTVSDMEKLGRDLKLSSLKRYVEATGSKLRLDIELPDGTHYGFSV
ncbi:MULTISPECIES: helix-turn-helix domain-containing protein [Photorhabdus]|uniref:Cro/Cl family transcriptional regulator n=5 Tax=Photorhabdus TaxID=29487 RepID=A0A0F7LM24_9GAMM|nr:MULTISPECIES: helix-turn-helix domain-containing protein [Photorhabdus]KGM26584.1 Cro/Cl family transcriptional regulator [Photorhabdus luminescens]AKH62931.1 Cro/Cl family transcriptional regulator [Photorhabdus thracensis]EYU14720.1 Helix-turn-helix protein [Photorhabdus aegyptia]MCC8422148.1 helix-turn-helix transcriptional regulator [Photorhabdus thracensis]NHB93538.1 XRE family transcriptional regulator [Photorhabdus cinerea]